ncbi:MAG: hypothetical protein AVDCRST_MAG35-1066 [uncultured Quadrisphaera sp.]|uniref:HTH hxlR-type domain-containing protein n=1 Tax=uncultured Quadrisphaera sp. TaxID=904978 RepID=A0A6J4P2C1_9ACTN|nr:MAG: hypothetical protein AVDCRST_MAG35-1066 [uncultured Quadrisphaera sp.]
MTDLLHGSREVTLFDVYAADCPARDLLSLATGRWAVLVVGALQDGPLRFGALRRRLEGISAKVLTEKLREMEDGGLLDRRVDDRPLAVHYELTPLGRGLVEPLAALRAWAETSCDGARDRTGGATATGG